MYLLCMRFHGVPRGWPLTTSFYLLSPPTSHAPQVRGVRSRVLRATMTAWIWWPGMCGYGERPIHVGAHSRKRYGRYTGVHAQQPPLRPRAPPTSVLNGATADEDVRGDAHAYCLHVCALTEGSPTYILHAVITCRLPAYGVGLYLLAPSRVFWCGRIRWLGRATRGVSVVGVLGGTRVAIGEEGA